MSSQILAIKYELLDKAFVQQLTPNR